MKVVILDKKVRHNLELFRHLIHRQPEQKKRFFQTARKIYKGFINSQTGEFWFSDVPKEGTPQNEWKPIIIRLRPDKEGAFEVLTPGEEDHFDCAQLKKEAYELLTKTLHILNQIAFDPKHGRNPFWILKHIAILDFDHAEKKKEGEKSLVHEAWHNVDRSHAEYLLYDLPAGTYLFRKDEFAQILEDTLNRQLLTPISCITLTYRDWDKKICEKTLIYFEGNWLFYNDEPNLLGPTYSSLSELLESMGDKLTKPLRAI